MSPEDLATELASVPGLKWSSAEWSDFLSADSATQARILDTLNTAAIAPGPDYWTKVLAVLKIGATIVGVAGGVESAITLVQSLAKA